MDPEQGGYLFLGPSATARTEREYIPRTNVLKTSYETATGRAEVLDALNTGATGPLPWTELVRLVRGVQGFVQLSWEFVPGNIFGQSRPWAQIRDGIPVVTVHDLTMAIVADGSGESEVEGHRVTGTIDIHAGEQFLLSVVGCEKQPLFIPRPETIKVRLDRTIRGWERWADLIEHDGPWRDYVVRSALTLKALLSEPADAIAAAATTSLPERICGDKNWDYRFAWVRDSSFTVDSLINLGLDEEVHASVSWLLAAIDRSRPELRVFYTLLGEEPYGASTLDVPGYRNSQPVRVGNDAHEQLQLGNYGDLFDTIFRYTESGHLIDAHSADLLADLADSCCDDWLKEDSGIWELPERRHYTISKLGCWVALDRASRLAAVGQLPAQHAQRWNREAAEIHAWILKHCWSERHGAYSCYAGTDELDASVLLAGRTGFDTGPRLTSTIEAVIRNLGISGTPLLYRRTGMDKEEGAFIVCTFWLIDALVRTGQVDRSRSTMDQAVLLCNDLGLLSEEIDPDSRTFLGNFPQGLSHLALISAAHVLGRAISENHDH